jgi:hypothetical protein
MGIGDREVNDGIVTCAVGCFFRGPFDFGYPMLKLVGVGWTWILSNIEWTRAGPHQLKLGTMWTLCFWIWTPVHFQVYAQESMWLNLVVEP